MREWGIYEIDTAMYYYSNRTVNKIAMNFQCDMFQNLRSNRKADIPEAEKEYISMYRVQSRW